MKTKCVFLIPFLLACASTQEGDQQEERICERVTTTGSQVSRQVCKTEQERQEEAEESQDLYMKIQPVPAKPGGKDF